MKDLEIFLKTIEMESIKNNFLCEAILLLNEINFLILKIKFCTNLQKAHSYFDLLDKIQLFLAIFKNKHGINLSNDFHQFLINFDQLHDIKERERLFTEIKKNQHVYERQHKILLQKILEDIEKEFIKENITVAQLDFLHKEINYLLSELKICKNIKEAEGNFDQLQRIQDVLSELLFKYNLDMNSNLKNFIRDYDRLDDPWLREYIFNEIKK